MSASHLLGLQGLQQTPALGSKLLDEKTIMPSGNTLKDAYETTCALLYQAESPSIVILSAKS